VYHGFCYVGLVFHSSYHQNYHRLWMGDLSRGVAAIKWRPIDYHKRYYSETGYGFMTIASAILQSSLVVAKPVKTFLQHFHSST